MRIVEFFDGFESSTDPDLGNIIATQMSVWPNDGAYEVGTDGTGDNGDLYLNSTSGQPRFFSTSWREFVTSFGAQTIAGSKTFEDNAVFEGNLQIDGDLIVGGNTVTLNTTVLDVEDANITVNKGGTQAAADNVAGLRIEMTDAIDAMFIFDKDVSSLFKIGDEGDEREVLTVSHAQTITDKFYDGGVATNSRAIKLPSETSANLNALTDVAGLIAYDTTAARPVYNDGLGWIPMGGGSIKFEERVVTVGEAAAKSLTLALTPLSASQLFLDFIEVGPQVNGTDYGVSGAVVDWTGLGMDSVTVDAGDILRIIYLA